MAEMLPGVMRLYLSALLLFFAPAVVSAAPDPAEARIAHGWSRFYAGRYRDAVAAVRPLIRADREAVAVEAQHIAARSLQAAGAGSKNNTLTARADRIWQRLERTSTLNVNIKRLKIAAALRADAAGDAAKAAAILKKLMAGACDATSTPEAAILYARIRARSGDRAAAAKACAFAAGFARTLTRSSGGESLSKRAVKPFIEAAGRLRERFSHSKAKLAFQKAEALRKNRKWTAAVSAYRGVMKDYPDTDYAPRSAYAIGLCSWDRGRYREADTYWRGFVDEDPVGPWRGQALVKMIDYLLKRAVDVPQAGETARRAAAGLETALGRKDASGSWQRIAGEIYLRRGILAYVDEDLTAAARFLGKAAEAPAPGHKTAQGIDYLLAAARAGLPLLPFTADTTKTAAAGDKHNTRRTTLALATAWDLLGRRKAAQHLFELVLAGRLGRPSPPAAAYACYGVGTCRRQAGADREAGPHLAKALRVSPDADWHDETLHKAALAAVAAGGKGNKKSANTKTANKNEIVALGLWNKLIERYPDSPRAAAARYHVGMILTRRGDYAAAAEH
ncbi:MAG: tetratricopeptide repeat protein, partial [Planctomycetota bacterium]|nr:tetratricopeptide repeat protein [Planctomycetota bacterium]